MRIKMCRIASVWKHLLSLFRLSRFGALSNVQNYLCFSEKASEQKLYLNLVLFS